MRHSYLLLALVASIAADNTAQPRTSSEKNSSLKPRQPAEISHPLDARHVAVDIRNKEAVVSEKQRVKRHDDDEDDDDFHRQNYQAPGGEIQDPDDDHHSVGDKGGDSKINVGAIVGAVVGSVIAACAIIGIWYCCRFRPMRRQQMLAASKESRMETGHGSSPSSSAHPSTSSVNENQSSPEHVRRWAPTPYPEHAPSAQTDSSMSGLALPTPALTYSPTISTARTTPNLAPTPPRPAVGDKPPSYEAVAALQSSEPQPEASAYQMGQVPVPTEPPMYELSLLPQPGATNMKGEPISRY
ncbi:hypothetical protein GGR54DRAFT_464550 [Hypoxylon sp. NC1633]|nr:hypothetical protein GGR54DRAFT_464550 [Hypoxylon sp. NC1633]